MGTTYAPRKLGGVQDGLTALAGGASTTTIVCDEGINVVDTVATAGDSVILPASIGQYGEIVVANVTAAALDIFPNSGATINGNTADANVGIAAHATAVFTQIGTDGLTWIGVGTSAATS